LIPDFRAPDAIRLAVSPLQTSFEEIWEGFSRIRDLVASKKYQEISNKDLRVT
jgi:kynureninase